VPLSSKFKIASFFELKGYPGIGLVMLHPAIVVRLLIICCLDCGAIVGQDANRLGTTQNWTGRHS